MSKAFTREDDQAPEPVVAGPVFALPPGVKNYLTPAGAARLRAELERLAALPAANAAERGRLAYLRQSLRAAEIVPPPAGTPTQVRFGTVVNVRDERGIEMRYRIVGIDEADAGRGWVSWRSPIAAALLKARVGQRVRCRLPAGEAVLEVVGIAPS